MAVYPIFYGINMTDPAQYAAANAAYPQGIKIPPLQASSVYGIPMAPGGPLVPPYITYYPAADANYVPYLGVENFTVIPFAPTSPPVQAFWLGYFYLANGPVGSTPSVPAVVIPKIGARRWVDGFELDSFGEGASAGRQCLTRDASRTPEGRGFAFRHQLPAGRTHSPPANTIVSWERVYIRLRVLPTGAGSSFWQVKGSVVGGNSALLLIDAAGAIRMYNKGNQAYPGTLMATSAPLVVGTWYRLDMYFMFNHIESGVTIPAQFKLYINGGNALGGAVPGSDGLTSTQFHAQSLLGPDTNDSVTNGLDADFDDWISANAIGAAIPSTSTPGLDLTSGSHVIQIRPNGFGPSHNAGAWAGDYRSLLSNPPDQADASARLVSTTANSQMAVTTDYVNQQNGYAAVTLGVFIAAVIAGVTTATVTIEIPTGTVVATQVMPTVLGGFWNNLAGGADGAAVLYSVPDGTSIQALPTTAPVFGYKKANSANSASVGAMLGAAEIIGFFGLEDKAGVTYPPRQGVHNAPYPLLPQTNSPVPPLAPFSIIQGTYTGNSVAQDLLFNNAFHWIWVREVVANGNGVLWFSSMSAAHDWVLRIFKPHGLETVGALGTGAFGSTTGNNAFNNLNATVYQYVAICDPAMRYVLNGAFSWVSSVASMVNNLVDPTFTPEAAFFMMETNSNSGATGTHYKGIGYAGNTIHPLDLTGDIATGAAFGAGTITSKAAIHTDQPDTAFSAFRRNDGSGQQGVLDLVTYVGDGTASRNIAVNLQGKSPMFVLGVPHAAAASYARDPSHTANNSIQVNNALNVTTAITAFAANVVTVGILLNANGTTYDLFVLPNGVVVPTIIRPTAGPYTGVVPAAPATPTGNLCNADLPVSDLA